MGVGTRRGADTVTQYMFHHKKKHTLVFVGINESRGLHLAAVSGAACFFVFSAVLDICDFFVNASDKLILVMTMQNIDLA